MSHSWFFHMSLNEAAPTAFVQVSLSSAQPTPLGAAVWRSIPRMAFRNQAKFYSPASYGARAGAGGAVRLMVVRRHNGWGLKRAAHQATNVSLSLAQAARSEAHS